jgi:branched-chain amino acid transport system substrate-binding protein
MRAGIWTLGNERTAGATRRGGRRRSAQVTALSVAALTAAAVAGCGSSASSSSSGSSSSRSAYTIHAILSLTGSASFLGDQEKAALQALATQVNASGGIDGHPLTFAISDNQSTASTAVSLATSLISTVPILIDGSLTTTDRPVDDLATSTGPVIWDMSPGDHPKIGSFVYSAGASTTSQTAAFVNFAESQGWKRIAAITSTDASGQDGWANIDKAVAASGGKVTIATHQTFDPTAVSVTTQLATIKASNPQALFIWTTGTPLGTVLKGMQGLGMGSLPTMTTNGNASYSQLKGLDGEIPSQLYFPGAPYMVGASTLTGQTKTQVQTFTSAMSKATGQPVPSEGDALAWDPGRILVDAVKKYGVGATAAQIHTYIESLSSFPGIGGTYDFVHQPSSDNRGLGINSVYITQWSTSQNRWLPVSGPAGNGKI